MIDSGEFTVGSYCAAWDLRAAYHRCRVRLWLLRRIFRGTYVADRLLVTTMCHLIHLSDECQLVRHWCEDSGGVG